MNYTLIILGIILILVLYILYRFITDRSSMVSSRIYLKDSPPDIKFDSLPKPNSTRYTYSLWIYVKSLQGNTDIISVTNKVANADEAIFRLYLEANGNLKFDILPENSNTTTSNIITSNFPLQKWVCVNISVDNNIVDTYIDGKLVKSQKMDSITQPTSSSIFKHGTGDIFLAEVERPASPTDPQTAWDRYMAGNGGSYIGNMFSSYGASLILTKDDIDSKRFTLF